MLTKKQFKLIESNTLFLNEFFGGFKKDKNVISFEEFQSKYLNQYERIFNSILRECEKFIKQPKFKQYLGKSIIFHKKDAQNYMKNIKQGNIINPKNFERESSKLRVIFIECDRDKQFSENLEADESPLKEYFKAVREIIKFGDKLESKYDNDIIYVSSMGNSVGGKISMEISKKVKKK